MRLPEKQSSDSRIFDLPNIQFGGNQFKIHKLVLYRIGFQQERNDTIRRKRFARKSRLLIEFISSTPGIGITGYAFADTEAKLTLTIAQRINQFTAIIRHSRTI